MRKIIFKKLNQLSNRTGQDLLGIDFSGNTLKIAHIRIVLNKVEVVSLLSRDISGLPNDEISRIIRASINDLNIKNAFIVNIISSQLIITKNIEIPSTDPKEIREIINLQAGRHTPYSREEIIVDYGDIGAYKHNYTKILLVIVARQVVKSKFDILDKAGIKLEKISLASEGIAWSCSKVLELQNSDLPISLIHIDESFTDFIVVFKDKAIFIRSIPIGAGHLIEEPQRYQDKFSEEIKSSLESYQSEDIEKSPNTIFLTGAVEELRTLPNILSDSLHLPVKVIAYLKNFSVSSGAFDKVALAKHLSFFSVIAPLLAWQDLKINLIPEEVKLRKALEERGKDLIMTGILSLAVFILFFSILISKIYFGGVYLKRLDAKYQLLDKEAQRLEDGFSKVSLIKNYLTRRGYSLEVLTELYNLAPVELQISDIRFDDQGRFLIRGTAESMPTVFAFVENMGKSKYFKDVKTRYTTNRKEGLRDVADFEIASIVNRKAE
jgi:Tfp pilus assembly PilM family ATPase/Tfp pilus assembly protein PilN